MCARVCLLVSQNVHVSCYCHLQASEKTAEIQVCHSAALSACWCITAAFQVSLSSVWPDSKVMHINSGGGMQPGFQIATLCEHTHTHTHARTAAPSPDGRAVRGAEAVVSQVQAAVVTGAECHTYWATPTPTPCPHTNQAPSLGT